MFDYLINESFTKLLPISPELRFVATVMTGGRVKFVPGV